MSFKDYSFVDETKMIVNPEKLIRDYPQIAELILFKGLSNIYIDGIAEIREKFNKNEDYSYIIKSLRDYIKAMDDFEYYSFKCPNITKLLNIMRGLINRDNVGELLAGMQYSDFLGIKIDIEKKLYDVRDVKEKNLSLEDTSLYSYLYDQLVVTGSETLYKLPINEVDINITKKGIKVNGRISDLTINKAYSNKCRIFREFKVDKILKDEFGMESPFQRSVAKSKLDPAVMTIIKLVNNGNPGLAMFERCFSVSIKAVDYNAEVKEQLIKQYMSQVLEMPLRTENKTIVTILYNTDNLDNLDVKKYARQAKGNEGIYVLGDLRNAFEILRDRIFGKKFENVQEEVHVEQPTITYEEERKEYTGSMVIDVNTGELVDAFEYDVSAGKVTTEKIKVNKNTKVKK